MMHFLDESAKLHFMLHSASLRPARGSRRDRQRHETTRRITSAARRLTDERGLDGFTLDDLAVETDVSRRTLFNHVPGKLDAVLGPPALIDAADLDEFRARGPHGDLVEDVLVAARPLVDASFFSPEEQQRLRRIMLGEPRLIIRAHERFDALVAEFAWFVVEREGPDFGLDRAGLLVRILMVAYDVALTSDLARPDADADADAQDFTHAFEDTVRKVRGIFC